jgi:hypothetical protein
VKLELNLDDKRSVLNEFMLEAGWVVYESDQVNLEVVYDDWDKQPVVRIMPPLGSQRAVFLGLVTVEILQKAFHAMEDQYGDLAI